MGTLGSCRPMRKFVPVPVAILKATEPFGNSSLFFFYVLGIFFVLFLLILGVLLWILKSFRAIRKLRVSGIRHDSLRL